MTIAELKLRNACIEGIGDTKALLGITDTDEFTFEQVLDAVIKEYPDAGKDFTIRRTVETQSEIDWYGYIGWYAINYGVQINLSEPYGIERVISAISYWRSSPLIRQYHVGRATLRTYRKYCTLQYI